MGFKHDVRPLSVPHVGQTGTTWTSRTASTTGAWTCVAHGNAAEVFTYGKHGSTFGGNPLACAAGLATLQAIEQEKLCENAKRIGDLIRLGFEAEFKNVCKLHGLAPDNNAGSTTAGNISG